MDNATNTTNNYMPYLPSRGCTYLNAIAASAHAQFSTSLIQPFSKHKLKTVQLPHQDYFLAHEWVFIDGDLERSHWYDHSVNARHHPAWS